MPFKYRSQQSLFSLLLIVQTAAHPIAHFVTRVANINGSQEPLEIEVIIRREVHSGSMADNHEPSVAVVGGKKQSPTEPLCVDNLPKNVLIGEAGVRTKRSQRNYSLPFKLAVVGEVGRGELTYKQAQQRYGIQGQTTVLEWCRRYANHLADFHAYRTTFVGAPPTPDVNPEQRIKQLETQLSEQKAQYEKQLKMERDKSGAR